MSANTSRSLDRILRTLRATMRTRGLPRPDRLVISTRSSSVHLEFTSAAPLDRLAGLLLWTSTLDGVSLVRTHRSAGVVSVAATGRTGSGIGIGLATTVTVTDLGGHLVELDQPRPVVLAVVGNLGRLGVFESEQVTFDELAQVVTTARAIPAGGVVGVAA
jgi:hypothetical protein